MIDISHLSNLIMSAHNESISGHSEKAITNFENAIHYMEEDLFSAESILTEGVYKPFLYEDMYVKTLLDYSHYLVLKLGKYEQALELSEKVFLFDPTLYCSAEAYGVKGAALLGLGKVEESMDAFILSQLSGCVGCKIRAIVKLARVGDVSQTYVAETFLKVIEDQYYSEIDSDDRKNISVIRSIIGKKRAGETKTLKGSFGFPLFSKILSIIKKSLKFLVIA